VAARRRDRGLRRTAPARCADDHGSIRQYLAPGGCQPGQILGGHRFLEPGHAVVGHPHRRAGGVPAVGVHIEFGVRADDLAARATRARVALLVGAPGLPDLDLHSRDAVLLDSPGQLLAGLLLVVAGETAAAVHRNVLARPAEQVGDRQAEESCLEIPQRDVNGGDGRRPRRRRRCVRSPLRPACR
jgi:hypothetical protein